MTRYCQRCGVEYEGTGTWCSDCLDVEGAANLWGRQPNTPESAEEKATVIKDLWLHQWSDREIARHLGISVKTVLRWRTRLGLAATNHGGVYGKSAETVARQIEQLARAKRGAPKKGNKAWNYTPGTFAVSKK